MRRRSDLVAAALILLALGLAAGCGRKAAKTRAAAGADAGLTRPRVHRAPPGGSFEELAARLDPSVVTVKAGKAAVPAHAGIRIYPWQAPDDTALGSGFVLDEEGYILTNAHVIHAAGDEVKVVLSGGEEFYATVVGEDEKLDLGLLKIAGARRLIPVTLGDSDTLEVGEWVMAIGNPFGLEHTVTAGIVSAKGRGARDLPAGPVKNFHWSFIQTDASINPGNSGGPLVDMDGNVVGINTAIDARGTGISFAIPINMATAVLPQLKAHGKVTRAYTGVFIQPVTPKLAEQLGLGRARGVYVADVVPGSPAARAGVVVGDVLLRFDGKEVDDASFAFIASSAAVGKRVELVLWRKRREVTAAMVTEKAPE